MGDMVSIGQMAQSAWQGVRYLKGLVNSELHQGDISGFVAPTSSGQQVAVTSIAQGDLIANRTGNSILLKKVYIRSHLQLHSSASQSIFRLVVVRDKQQVADASPSYETVFSPGGGVLSALNTDNLGRFEVLYDKSFVVDSTDPLVPVEVCVPTSSHVRYNGPGSMDINKGGIYVVCASNEPTNAPVWSYRIRAMWHDN